MEGESDEEEAANHENAQAHIPATREDTSGGHTGQGAAEGSIASSLSDNRCDLLWQGTVPKRIFHAFRFQVFLIYDYVNA